MRQVEGQTVSVPAPTLSRVLSRLGRILITAGIVVLLFVVYQLWGTDLQEARAQDSLREEFTGKLNAAAVDDPVVTDQSRPTSTTLPATPAPSSGQLPTEAGEAMARLEMASIDVDKVVVSGVAVADLRKGPGHYSQTSNPGSSGNSAIAGHRTTYGSPFNRIDELMPGDEIAVTTLQGRFTYRILDPEVAYAQRFDEIDDRGPGHIIVDPDAAWVLDDFGDDRLTLTACHPKLSSRQRIIVAAELTEAPDSDEPQPVGVQPSTEQTPAQPNPVTDTPQSAASSLDLDGALGGERGAVVPAVEWMVAAIALWSAASWGARHYGTNGLGRFGVRLVGAVPASACLWFSFELIDRALPAA